MGDKKINIESYDMNEGKVNRILIKETLNINNYFHGILSITINVDMKLRAIEFVMS